MTVLFITVGGESWASARIRGYWPARCMDARVVTTEEGGKNGLDLEGVDVVIWQKTASIELIQSTPNIRHFWDVCDPVWWWAPEASAEVAQAVEGIVASSTALAEEFSEWSGLPCNVIPDRLELSHFSALREHHDSAPTRLIWFGLYGNRPALFGALANLERLAANGRDIELTICDERPELPLNITKFFPVYHVRWELEQENAIIAAHDIAILPPYPGSWGRVKSNNRILTAWACGIPATDCESYKEMVMLMDPETRARLGADGRKWVEEDYNVEQSAREWERLLDV